MRCLVSWLLEGGSLRALLHSRKVVVSRFRATPTASSRRDTARPTAAASTFVVGPCLPPSSFLDPWGCGPFPLPSSAGHAPPSEITPPPRCVCHPAHARERVCGPPPLGADPSPPVLVGGGARCVLVVPSPSGSPFFCTLRAIVSVLPAPRRLLVWSCRRPWHVARACSRLRTFPCPRTPLRPLPARHVTLVSPRPWCSPQRRPLGAAPPPPHPPPRWPSRAHPAWPRLRRRRRWRRRRAPLACAWPCHPCPPSRRSLRCCTTRARRPPRRRVVAAPLGATGRP